MPALVVAVVSYVATAFAGAAALAAGYGAFAIAAIKLGVSFVVSAIGNKLFGGARPSASPQARTETIRAAAENRRVIYGKMRSGGVLFFAETNGDENKQAHMLLALCHGEINSIAPAFWLNNDSVDGPKFRKKPSGWAGLFSQAWIQQYAMYNENGVLMGGTASNDPMIYAEVRLGAPGQGFLPILNHADKWTPDHRLNEVAYVYLQLRYDKDFFKTGLPSASFLVEGRKLYDPRTETTYFNANPALCVLDYLRADFGMQCPDSLIDYESFIAAANICDEIVGSLSGPMKRYSCNGIVDLGSNPSSIVGALESSCGGRLVFSGGKYKFFAGAYQLPSSVIEGAALRGSPTVRTAPSRSSLFNTVRGLYCEPLQNYQDTDYPGQVSEEGIVLDQGEIVQQVDLPFTTNAATAQRLAHIALSKSRGGRSVTIPLNWSGLGIKLYDVVTLDIPGVPIPPDVSFRVMEWSLVEGGGVDVVLQEENASFYDWDHTTQEKPVVSSGEDQITGTPTALTGLNADLLEHPETAAYKLEVYWNPVIYSGVAVHYEVSKRLAGTATWGEPVETLYTQYVETAGVGSASYDVRVRGVGANSTATPWVQVATGAAAVDLGLDGVALTGLNIVAAYPVAGVILAIEWDDALASYPPLYGYEYQTNVDGGAWSAIAGSASREFGIPMGNLTAGSTINLRARIRGQDTFRGAWATASTTVPVQAA